MVVPEAPVPAGGRKVVAFTHGTVGIARDCAPSLQRGAIAQVIEGIGEFVASGYVVAATDYQGLGTPGPHPYLVGRVEAMNALDSVRAAHRLRQAHAGVRFAVWGHSQGGQAALFTGQLARSYAPGLHLVGVAAGAPVPSLEDFFRVNRRSTAGKLLLALALDSWSAVYDAPAILHVLAPASRPAVAQIAGYCLSGGQSLAATPSALALALKFAHLPRWRSQPWSTIRAQNTPGTTSVGVPILITQGGADKVVPRGAQRSPRQATVRARRDRRPASLPGGRKRGSRDRCRTRRARLDRRPLRRSPRPRLLRLRRAAAPAAGGRGSARLGRRDRGRAGSRRVGMGAAVARGDHHEREQRADEGEARADEEGALEALRERGGEAFAAALQEVLRARVGDRREDRQPERPADLLGGVDEPGREPRLVRAGARSPRRS